MANLSKVNVDVLLIRRDDGVGSSCDFSNPEVVVLSREMELHLGDGDGHHSSDDSCERVLKVVPGKEETKRKSATRKGNEVGVRERDPELTSRERRCRFRSYGWR